MTGPGTYPLGAIARVMTGTLQVSPTVTNIWTTSATGGTGSVTITSITNTRLRGTFTATLVPLSGTNTTGTVAIANGTFDMGLQAPP